jgi:lysozyme
MKSMSKELETLTIVPFSTIYTQLAEEEGLRLKVYKCTAGFNTVGIGHNLDALQTRNIIGRDVLANGTITDVEAQKIFEYDLTSVLRSLHKNISFFSKLDAALQYVLISLAFNMGIGGLMQFKNTLKAFDANNTTNIINGLSSSKWSKQVPNRAKKLMNIVRSRTFPKV